MKRLFTTCIECQKNPIYIIKYSLCRLCYHKKYKMGTLDRKDGDLSRPTEKKVQQSAELNFVKNYFAHNNWIYHPTTFRLNGTTYQPDFYDPESNVFIEVVGTRQAYHANKNKYHQMKKLFPLINFIICKEDGSVLTEDERIDWSA